MGGGLKGNNIDHAKAAFRVGVVGIMFFNHFDRAHNALFIDRVIEKSLIAQLHRLHMFIGQKIPDPVPMFALALAVELVLPAPSIGFGFEKPISHIHASLRIGVRKTADQMIPAANFHRFKQTGFMIGVIIDKSLRLLARCDIEQQ